jgi:UDP-N-acetylmuramoyl-tripeptide--D-alanyl-D-alanine ligase
MNFSELAKITGGELLSGDPKGLVGFFAVDSRLIKPGEVFVALKGERADGNDFVSAALKSGAAGAIVSRVPMESAAGAAVLLVGDTLKALQDAAKHVRAERQIRVVGVTGSNGKTTTKEMIASVLAAGGKTVFSTKGNFNSQIGLPLMIWEMPADATHAVFEMGASGKGDIAALASIAKPHVGVVTNVGRAHLASFGSQDGVADAKWELVEALPSDGTAVLNADDPRLMVRRPRTKARVVTFGVLGKADVRAEDLRQEPQARFTLVVGDQKSAVKLPTGGAFNVLNALAAAAVGMGEGVAIKDIVRGLESFRPAALRMQLRRGKGGALFVIDAYNANPDSMWASLESFALAYRNRRRVAVLGGMLELGASGPEEHRALGALAGRLDLARVFFLGEEGHWVRDGWREESRVSLVLVADKAALRDALAEECRADTVLLFKASRGVGLEDVFQPLLEE